MFLSSAPEPPEGVSAEPIDGKEDNSQHAKILVRWQVCLSYIWALFQYKDCLSRHKDSHI